MKAIFTIRLLLFLVLTSLQAFAQPGSTNPDRKRTQIWYFGYYTGLDFANEPPTVLSGSPIFAYESNAVMCDTSGELLFYTNGVTVWNKYHQVMVNGSGLNGDLSATQEAIIVPHPANGNLYYVFTNDAIASTNGLQYSIVDISLRGDSGEVLTKNVLLHTPVHEKLTATKHQNGHDIWVTTKGWNDSCFFSWLITDKGLINCPVISCAGVRNVNDSNLDGADAVGAMKFSSNGRLLAKVNTVQNNLEIFDFDNTNAVFKKRQHVERDFIRTYGVEFSPNNELLYVTDRKSKLYQVDYINDSVYEIYSAPSDVLNCIQTTPRGELYIAKEFSRNLAVIKSPNSLDTACHFRFDSDTFPLANQKSRLGLPNYITSYFHNPAINFSYSLSCSQDTGEFMGLDTNSVSQWNWQFQHLSSGVTSTYNIQNIIHVFSDTGRYEVRLIATHGGGSDTVIKMLTITKPQPLNLGPDKIICVGDSLVLRLGPQFRCYTWENNSQVVQRVLKTSGTYSIQTVNENFCIERDTILLTIQPLPPKPTITRSNDTLYSSEAFSYQWYKNGGGITSATNRYFKVTENASFQVVIADSIGCTNISDPIQVNDLSIVTPAGQQVNIYPNPAHQSVNVVLSSINSFKRLSFYNLLGQSFEVPIQVQNSSITADIHALPAGMYMLRIDFENEVIYTKIIVESNQP